MQYVEGQYPECFEIHIDSNEIQDSLQTLILTNDEIRIGEDDFVESKEERQKSFLIELISSGDLNIWNCIYLELYKVFSGATLSKCIPIVH